MTDPSILTGLREAKRLIECGAADSALTIITMMINKATPKPTEPFDDENYDIVYKS